MVRRFSFLVIWLGFTGLVMLTGFFLLGLRKNSQIFAKQIQQPSNTELPQVKPFFAFEPFTPPVETLASITMEDERVRVLEKFLGYYHSPLKGHASYLVEVADRYNLDYRLLPAIAMQESGGGKVIPDGTYNAWGYAITETQTLGFMGWEEAIDRVARGLKKDYIDKGLVTPEQIMTKYTPASLEKGGAWAKGVNYFIEQLP